MTISTWTAQQKIVAGFAIVMAAAGLLALASLYVLHGIDGMVQPMLADHPEQAARLHNAVLKTYGIILGVGALGTLLSLASLWGVVSTLGRALKELAQKLSASSNQVNSAAAQVAESSQSLADGSCSQAAALEETSSALEEMAHMTKRNAESANQANNLARATRTAAEGGAVDMSQMSAAMAAIQAASNDIANIIKTIDEVAFQTNILALNAAVEAARAGERGAGFAVVADEVRKLAQRSARAAQETAEKIQGAIGKTRLGVELNSKVAAALNDIVAKVRQMDELTAQVAAASREQTEGITQINAAVGEMDRVTQGNAAVAEESAAAALDLDAQAHSMREAVVDLQQVCGSSAAGRATPTAATAVAILPAVRPAPGLRQRLHGNGHSPANGSARRSAGKPEIVQPARTSLGGPMATTPAECQRP